jgi:hypothetical protein
MIDSAIRSNPDSGYVLVQHALMADQALHQAQAQIAQLQAQLAQAAQPAPQPSFLGGGMAPPPQQQGPWGQQPPVQQQPMGQPYYGSGPFSGGGGLGSFLRSAGTMAAGVAGGELLFSGLSGMFGGHGGGFGGGGFGGGGTENVTVNNYNDDDSGDDRSDDDDYSGADSGGDDNSY